MLGVLHSFQSRTWKKINSVISYPFNEGIVILDCLKQVFYVFLLYKLTFIMKIKEFLPVIIEISENNFISVLHGADQILTTVRFTTQIPNFLRWPQKWHLLCNLHEEKVE